MAKKVEKTKVKVQEKKVVEEKNKRMLSDKAIAITYMFCAVLWLASGVLNVIAGSNKKWIVDFVLTALLVALGIVYFIKDKKNKTQK